MSMDISDFYQTFFDEADELLADMEQHLLDLVPEAPDSEQLNAIFRAAHSIKGGAGTFGFTILQETTHLMENLLDEARRGEMQLNTDIINLFLETKDIMQEQLDAYKSSAEPDAASFEYICNALRQLALEAKGEVAAAVVPAAKLSVVDAPAAEDAAPAAAKAGKLRVVLSRLKENEVNLLEEELGNLATLSNVVKAKTALLRRSMTVSARTTSWRCCALLSKPIKSPLKRKRLPLTRLLQWRRLPLWLRLLRPRSPLLPRR